MKAMMRIVSQTYTQEPHCCADERVDPALTLSIHDGGGAPYLVFDAHAWACSDAQEIQELADAAKALLAQADRQEEVQDNGWLHYD